MSILNRVVSRVLETAGERGGKCTGIRRLGNLVVEIGFSHAFCGLARARTKQVPLCSHFISPQ